VSNEGNPARALEIARHLSGPIDVLVTDMVLPGMNGPALAQKFNEFRPGTRVLFMSGYTESEEFENGQVPAKIAFLQKALTDKVSELLQRS